MLADRYVSDNYVSYEDFCARFRLRVPERFNFSYDIVDEYAEIEPERRALVWCDEQGREAEFNFREIKHYSDRYAAALTELGIKRGDAVLLILKRRYEYWFAATALLKVGAIIVPINHMMTKKDIEYRVSAANIKMILCVDDERVLHAVDEAVESCPGLKVRAKLGGERRGWVAWERAADEAPPFTPPAERPLATDPMLMFFTSGTTGYPKIATQNYSYPLGHIITAKYIHNVGDGGLHLTVADTGWAKAAWGKIFGQWICGAAVFVYDYDRFVPKDLLDVVSKHRVNTFCAPPTIYRFLIKEDLSKWDLSALKHCSTAGEPLNAEVFNQFKQQMGIEIRECYGQSESTPILATFNWLEPKPGSLGRPSPAYDVVLLNTEGQLCEVGEEGEVAIRTDRWKSPGMFDGYFSAEQGRVVRWEDELYFTGDIAWRDEDGYYWFVGRSDDVIKSSGYRIGPFEVESALLEHPAVVECAITGVPHPDRGQVIKATVVLDKRWQPSDELIKELQNHVKRITAPYKYPRIVEFVDELPKTISGKILRRLLRS